MIQDEARSCSPPSASPTTRSIPVQDLPYGKQRLVEIAIALGLKPKVLLLDEPAAGVPSMESERILRVLDRLPPEIAILIIEHDMDLVFRFAQRITVLVQGEVLVEGHAGRDRARPPRAPGVPRRAAPCLTPCSIRSLRAGYGETVMLEDVALTLPERGSLAVLGRNGVGKTTLLATVMGHTSFHSGSDHVSRS